MRLEHVLRLIARDPDKLKQALRLTEAAVMDETAGDLEQGIFRLTPPRCRVFYYERPDGKRIRLE